MMAKPIEEKSFLHFLKMVGWSLGKGSIDYKLYDEKGAFLCSIKISHGKGKKREVVPDSVRKTERFFKERGWSWPPQKKLKNIS